MEPSSNLTLLVSARRNSKYLAKFLMGYFDNTNQPFHTDMLVMLNEHDTWNRDLARYFEGRHPNIRFFYENERLGRAGLHVYFNMLIKQANKTDWFIYFCEDHYIQMRGWDDYVRAKMASYDPNHVYIGVPKFDNAGAMSHILSRGYVEAVGGVGHHGWIDSYINELAGHLSHDRIISFDDEMFHDFTHDQPSPMSDAHMQSVDTTRGQRLPRFEAPEVRQIIADDANNIFLAIQKEGK